MTDEEKQVNELIDMIDGKMSNGVSRLSIGFSEDLFSGVKRETYHHGRCDVGSPWAMGTISNCDVIDADEEDYRNKKVTLKISKGIG